MTFNQSKWLYPLVVSSILFTACSSSSSTPSVQPDGDDPETMTGDGMLSPVTTDPGSETSDPVVPDATPSDGGNSVITGSASLLGTVNLSYEPVEDLTDVSAFFFNLEGDFSAAQLEQGFEDQVSSADICEVIPLDFGIDGVNIDEILEGLGEIPAGISAGEVITLTSSEGTYASLMAIEAFGFSFYTTQDQVGVAGEIPQNLTVDIPGAAGGFPAFSNIATPTSSPLDIEVIGNGDGGLTLSWNPESDGMRALSVSLTAFDLSGSDFSSVTNISCALQDDGSQVIAPDMLPGGDVLVSGFATRTGINFIQQGNAFLVVTSSTNASIASTNL